MEIPEAPAPLVGQVGETLAAHDDEAILGMVSVVHGSPTDEELAAVTAVIMTMMQPDQLPASLGYNAWSMANTGESQGKRPFSKATDRRLHSYKAKKWYREGRPATPQQAQAMRFPTSS